MEEQPLKQPHHKKQLIQDEDGFFTKGYRNREGREGGGGQPSEGEQQQQQQQQQQQPTRPNPTTNTKSKKTNNTNEKIDDSNIFASLTELND